MPETWYAILAVLFAGYLVLDGWNIGLGMRHCSRAHGRRERGLMMQALGASWSWNEVWLIAFGGVLFMAFPPVYAALFSSLALGLFLLLWSLILRGIAIEVRHLLANDLWHDLWDAVFGGASLLVAGLIGLAMGTVLRGIPLDARGDAALPFFTSFSPRGAVGLIDWYTVSIAAFTIVVLIAHGAAYRAATPGAPLRPQAFRTARRGWALAMAMLPIIAVLTLQVRSGFAADIASRPLGLAALMALATSVLLLAWGLCRRQPPLALVGSCAVIASLVLLVAALMFPVLIRSTTPDGPSLTASGSGAAAAGLRTSLWWFAGACLLVAGQIVFLARRHRHDAAAAQAQGDGDAAQTGHPGPGTHLP